MIAWLNNTEVLDNPILLWLYAGAAALLGYVIVKAALGFTTRSVRARHARSPSTARAVALSLLDATRRWLVFLLALVIASDFLEFKPPVTALLAHAGFALVGLQMALWANSLIALWLQRTSREPGKAPINPVLAGMLSLAAQFVVWTVLLMFFLANVGVNITAFVASLGIGGIAVALALQNILGDLFSSMAIGLDKPFEVGQFIAFGKVLGTVVHVGVKTTRINSLSGEQLVISNTNLLKELIHNYSRMVERRVVFGFRVPYGTSREHVATIPARVRLFIESEIQARFDRGHFANFGEFGPEFEFVYYVLDPGFNLYRDIQQRVNLKVMELFEELNVEFAVPTRQVRISTSCGAAAALSAPQS